MLSNIGIDINSYKYLKEAFKGKTEVNGGLVVTNVLQLRQTSDVNSPITAGISGLQGKANENGVVDKDTYDITAIAAWFGGPMVDKDIFTDEQIKNKVAGTDYARSLFRHDGSGYLASGAIYWGTDGILHGNPNSFILQGTSLATMFSYIRLFYLHYANTSDEGIAGVDYITPTKTFSRLDILTQGGTEAGLNLPTGLFIGSSTTGGSFKVGNVVIRTKEGDPNILEIVSATDGKTAHLGVQGGVSAYGTYTPSTGGGGGLNATVVSYSNIIAGNYSDTDLTTIPNAYSIKVLYNAIQNIDVTSQLGNYLLKTDAADTYQPKGNYLTTHQTIYGLTIQKNGANLGTYNPKSKAATINVTVPTKISELSNDSGYTNNIGTVTSVGVSVPTGLSITGSPITTKGIIAITFAEGYSIPTIAKQTSWDGISTLESYFTNDSAKKALQLTNARKLWGNTFNGTSDVDGSIIIPEKNYISIGGIKIIYDATNKALKIDGNLYSTGGISAYGTNDVSGGGGLNASVISYASILEGSYVDTDLTSIPNAYSIKALSNRINNIATELGGLNLSWNNITDKPTTFTPSAHKHKWIDITDRITKVSQLTNDAGYLITHQSLANYYTKAEIDEKGYTTNKGTVTSVGLTLPTGLTCATKSITTSGTFAVSFASGYSIPTTTKQSSWDSAVSVKHSHSNKTVLDGITSTKVTNWDSAYSWYSLITTDEETADGIINKWNEVVNFLANIAQTDTLSGIIDGINTSISNEVSRAKKAEGTNASNISANKTSITTLQGYFTNGSAKKALQLTTARKLWGNDFNGTTDINGSIVLPNGKYISIGNIKLEYDATNKALKITNTTTNEVANLYTSGGVSAYGVGTSSSSGGGLNGSVKAYADAIRLTTENLSEIASAYSIKALDSRISSLEGGSATAISVSGSGNAVTSITKNGTTISVVKGSTFLTSHQSLSAYLKSADAANIYSKLGHTHSYAGSASAGGDATRALKIKDYNGSYDIYCGFGGDGLLSSEIAYIVGIKYVNNTVYYKDVRKGELQKWLGLGNRAYDNTSYLPLTGGTLTGNLNGTGAIFGGRIYGSGDDEGILIKTAGDGWAGLILGSTNSDRSCFYFSSSNALWKYVKDGTDAIICHPHKSGTIALISDIPTKISSLSNDSGYITSSGSISGNAATATNADKVDNYHAYKLFRDLGWWSSSETHNANDIKGNASVFAYTTHSNVPTTGVLTTFSGGNDAYNWQMAKAYTWKGLYIRQRNGDNSTWSDWIRLLDESDLTWSSISNRPTALSQFTDDILSGKYLPLGGGAMNANARISASGGDLYIGNADDSGYLCVQNMKSQVNSYNWQIRTNGAAKFKDIYIATSNANFAEDTNVIEDFTSALCLNWYSKTNVNLCNGGGNVNIGMTGTGKLNVNGSILATGGITAYSSSDICLKQDLRKLDYLGIIKAMGGTYGFAWKKDNTRSIGWIAQHVLNNPYMSDIVETDENGYYKINYWSPKLIATAFGAIEQVDDEVSKLKARVTYLESEVERLTNDNKLLMNK